MKLIFPHRIVLMAGLLALPLVFTAGCGSNALQRYKDDALRHEQGRVAFSNGLAFSLHPRQEVFKQGEPAVIDFRITNVTNVTPPMAAINVYGELQHDGFLISFELYKVDGERRLFHASEGLNINTDDALPAYSNYVRLLPGFFFGRPIQLPSKLPAGIYQMTAIYASTQDLCLLSPRLTPDQIRLLEGDQGNEGFVKLWKGLLKSNTVVFQVK